MRINASQIVGKEDGYFYMFSIDMFCTTDEFSL